MDKDEEIKQLNQQIEELTNNWKRALADYQNLEKRINSEKQDFVTFANAGLLIKFLKILDHLEKAQSFLKDKGLELAITEFKKILKEEGVSEIEALDKDFDPNKMESVEVVKGEKEGQVAEVLFKGYTLNNRLLLPAKVKIYKKTN